MSGWNMDMTKAPRGRYRVVANPNGNGSRKVFERQEIILAMPCGAVSVSYYLPDDKRWNMMAFGQQPIAWMPYAGPRVELDEEGRKRSFIDLPKHPTMATSWFQDLLAEQRAAA